MSAVIAMRGRLLILDDEPTVGKVLARAAEKIGFRTATTCVPGEFFRQVAQWQPSHVAIDLSMPEMGGLEVLTRLAELGCTARILVTSGSDTGRLDDALAHARGLGLATAGALPKPFSLPLLRALLAAR